MMNGRRSGLSKIREMIYMSFITVPATIVAKKPKARYVSKVPAAGAHRTS